jgi:hypothetical protein
MPKYSQYSSPAEYEKKKVNRTISPVWRGVGFIIMIAIPIASYFLSTWVLKLNAANNWLPVPADLLSKGLDPLIYIKLGMTIVISIIVYGIFTLFGMAGLSVFGPPRYGELDAPPVGQTGGRKRWE